MPELDNMLATDASFDAFGGRLAVKVSTTGEVGNVQPENIKRELVKNGPVIVQTNVFTDFLAYKEGSYVRTQDAFRFPNGVHVLKGPLSYYAASYGRGGRDFRLDSDLMSGSCYLGGSFGEPDYLLPQKKKHDAEMKKEAAKANHLPRLPKTRQYV